MADTDDTKSAVNPTPVFPDHRPPMFAVRDPVFTAAVKAALEKERPDAGAWPEFAEVFVVFTDPETAIGCAKQWASDNPGKMIDIYRHATAIRSPE